MPQGIYKPIALLGYTSPVITALVPQVRTNVHPHPQPHQARPSHMATAPLTPPKQDLRCGRGRFASLPRGGGDCVAGSLGNRWEGPPFLALEPNLGYSACIDAAAVNRSDERSRYAEGERGWGLSEHSVPAPRGKLSALLGGLAALTPSWLTFTEWGTVPHRARIGCARRSWCPTWTCGGPWVTVRSLCTP
jgi:hypothetical protein